MSFTQEVKTLTGNKELYPCIDDLIEHGVCFDRFSAEEIKPTRHETTLFLANWLNHAGANIEEARDWLINYAVDVLAPISSSSKSQIRHSTKSAIKYMFNNEVPFACGCEENNFKAHCKPSCPLHDEMTKKNQEAKDKASLEREQLILTAAKNRQKEEPKPEKKITIIDQYREQYLEAVVYAHKLRAEGMLIKDIATKLNEKKFKSKKGLDWNLQLTAIALKQNQQKSVDEAPKKELPKEDSSAIPKNWWETKLYS